MIKSLKIPKKKKKKKNLKKIYITYSFLRYCLGTSTSSFSLK